MNLIYGPYSLLPYDMVPPFIGYGPYNMVNLIWWPLRLLLLKYHSTQDKGSLRKFCLDIDKTRYIKTETKRFFEVELTPKQIFDDGKASQLIKENSIIFEETLR